MTPEAQVAAVASAVACHGPLLPRRPDAERARQRLVAVHHRRRADDRLRRHAHREFRARLVLHAGRLFRRHAHAAPARRLARSARASGRRPRCGARRRRCSASPWRCCCCAGSTGRPSCSSCSPPSASCSSCRTWCSRSGGRRTSSGRARPGLRAPVEILGQRFPSYELFLIAVGPAGARACCGCSCTRRASACWCAPRPRTARWSARSASTRRCCSPARCSSARSWPGSAARCRCRSAPATRTWTSTSSPRPSSSRWSAAWAAVPGAFLAALLIGQLQAFGILVFPKITLVLVFLLMALVLVVRPWGLLGRPEAAGRRVMLPAASCGRLRPSGAAEKRDRGRRACAVLLLLPLVGDAYALKVATEVLIFAPVRLQPAFPDRHRRHRQLRPCRLFRPRRLRRRRWLVTPSRRCRWSSALLAARRSPPRSGAALFGFFIVRLSGIYLAMLTLAVGADRLRGRLPVGRGDRRRQRPRRRLAVAPGPRAAIVYYYLALAVDRGARSCCCGTSSTRRSATRCAPRAIRSCAPTRSASTCARHRWLAFILAGAAAGLAGGLFAFLKGSIDPTLLGIPMSIDCAGHAAARRRADRDGPARRRAPFCMPCETRSCRSPSYWRLMLGLRIIAMVLAVPARLVGAFERARAARLARAGAA